MGGPPKIPPVYKPTRQPVAAPTVYRPHGGTVTQLSREARRTTPVYRPQQTGPHRKPGALQPQAMGGRRFSSAPVIQRMDFSSATSASAASSTPSFETFIEQAWPVVKAHWDLVEETNPGAEVDTRAESTEARFVRQGFGPETGKNTDAHAEWTPVDRFYVSFPGAFPEIVKGGELSCAGNKPTCFMCAAIAHTLGIRIQKKDARGYGGHYALPGFMAEEDILVKFVGQTAFQTFSSAGKPLGWLAKLPNALYQRHSANKYFQV